MLYLIHLKNMEQSDIKEILSLLKKSIKQEDWDCVVESIEYLEEFIDDVDEENDD